MAKSAKSGARVPKTVVDEQGFESDGMFRWGGPKTPLTRETFEEWARSIQSDFHISAPDRIEKLRAHLTSFIEPHVDGPFEIGSRDPQYGRTTTHLNLSSGNGIYAYHEGLPKYGYWVDAADAIQELDRLSESIADPSKNIHRIVRSAHLIGMLTSRAELRAIFAEDVLIAKKRRKASVKGGKATGKWSPKIAPIARKIFAEFKRGKISDTAAYQRTATKLGRDHQITISAKTLRRHLSDKDNA